jgi:putative copper resistance protein D
MKLLAAGISSADPLIDSLSTVSKFISITASFATVGALLAMGFLLFDKEGSLGVTALKLRVVASVSALTWFIASAVLAVTSLANILGTSLGAAFDFNTLRSFLTQVTLGQYMLFQSLVAALVALSVLLIKKTGGAIGLLVLSIVGIIAPVFQSHSASSGSHALAIGSLAIHVIALAFWVGGVIAISLLGNTDRSIALPRFSALALWAAIAVVFSGSANAWARMNFAAAWDTGYAKVIITKVLLTVILLYFGYQNRKNLARKSSIDMRALAQLIFAEVVVMAIATALGSWLSTHQSPTPKVESAFDPALAVAGISDPGAPSLWKLVSLYDPDAFILGLIIIAVALYIKGVRVLSKRGDSWPVGRTVAFALGIAAIDFATSGGLGIYAKFSFEYHMIAHMILAMIAPIGIVLGAPVTLALRTLPIGRNSQERGVRGTLIALLHSKPTSVFTNPIVVLAIFDGSLFVLYFTSLFGGMMQSHVGHLAMNIHFILAGILFFHVIIGIDPNPRKVPHIVRIVILFAAMSIHAFFSIAIISTSTLLDQGYYKSLESPWLGDLLADQHAGGSIGWAMGEIPILLALVATFIQWMRDDSREAKRIDRNEARLAAMGEPDELADYNTYLAKLNQRDGQTNS